jgi:hypothetical protein
VPADQLWSGHEMTPSGTPSWWYHVCSDPYLHVLQTLCGHGLSNTNPNLEITSYRGLPSHSHSLLQSCDSVAKSHLHLYFEPIGYCHGPLLCRRPQKYISAS